MAHVSVPSVRIVQLSPDVLQALADGDLATADALAPVPLTAWLASEDRVATWRMRARQAVESPEDLPWVTGVVRDEQAGLTVGAGGFHAAPDERGMVEAGYGVDPAYRRRGYARAVLELLIDRARTEPAVTVLRLTISPENEPSLALARQYPFVEVGEQWDEEDGLETIYELEV
ncbi:GNAT family N-acetyltransferase [Nocardioides lianchengensis]|uniref:Protein N-acetyltransferase, RimJ/RimL family n=1 Tax=Nocardioides lianchengensis TaxID=1045774 RepID=A0A1G6SS01_9ACTN|nr:GNAT family N-acetyltransferase [Nocardioides lianchengensis]NYG09946.1 RimJ/RimL family protein N-acetyltransferase [Nocardioides lianchengensis]SDD19558.1 Protein N-acetyltransferase, RimJ/RimL family [Nocardioides lianchengensis]